MLASSLAGLLLTDFCEHSGDEFQQFFERMKVSGLVGRHMLDSACAASGSEIGFQAELDDESSVVLPGIHEERIIE